MRHRIIKGIGLLVAFLVAGVALGAFSVATLSSLGFMTVSPIVKFWQEAPDTLKDVQINQHTVMYDKNGSQFAEIWSENRKEVSDIKDISEPMRNAIVSAEDKNFYKHGAIDVVGTVRSVLTGSGGGSGITQQLMKNLIYFDSAAPTADKENATAVTIERKIKELKLAINYENKHSKSDILKEYLNTVAVGSPNIYGVETASETIFNKQAKDLTLGEAAALAGSVNNPSLFNLMNNDDKATADRIKKRQKYVLGRMLADGYINKKDYNDAASAPIQTNIQHRAGSCGGSKYPFYCQLVIEYLLDDTELGSTPEARQRAVNNGGLEIHTNMDPHLMDTLDAQLKNDWGVTNSKIQSTAVVQPGGAILAIGANRDWGTDASQGQTQIVLANRGTQTGSTYKMMTLATALVNGWDENRLNTVYGQCPWRKAGYDYPSGGIYNSTSCAMQGGALGYQKATAYSSNTWFVELETEVGVEKVKQFSGQVGLKTPDEITDRSASFTLGVVDDSPIQMAGAYATFINKGVYCPATPISSMKMIDGSALQTPDDYDPSVKDCRAVMSPYAASVVLKAQNANVNGNIPGRFGQEASISGRDTVGKSGTTNDYANLSWSQSVGQFTVYSNAYDPRGNYAYPMTYYAWRGSMNGPFAEPSMHTTRDFIINALNGQPNVPLDFNNQDKTYEQVASNAKNMVEVPNLVGMKPDQALKVLSGMKLQGKVLKTTGSDGEVKNNSYYDNGTVIKQSITPGTRLVIGGKTIVELTISTGQDSAVSKQPAKTEEKQPQ